MILFLLLVSRQGKVRLAKWWKNFTPKEKTRIMRDVSTIALGRSVRLSNFVPFNLPAVAPSMLMGSTSAPSYQTPSGGSYGDSDKHLQRYTLVCKRYASLSFIACVESVEDNRHLDEIIKQAAEQQGSSPAAASSGPQFSPGENELLTLEIIHYFVEALDKYFGNVCELDLIYHFQKAYMVLDEVILGGELQETSKRTILKYVQLHEQLMEEESGQGAASGGSATGFVAAAAAAAGVSF